MAVYLNAIKIAFMTFPIIAFLITLPFLIYHYQKYGAIPFLRGVIIYTFVLYLMSAFFLVILPLPSRSVVMRMKVRPPQLVPFYFVQNIKETTHLILSDINTYLPFLRKPTVYTVLFNFFLTVPFGIYLSYYFNKKWYQILLYTFLLSLFFEVTQLTGIYGIYPKAYRLFDVDDLIINTSGGMFGCLIAPLVTVFLPTRKELDLASYKKGNSVSIYRRGVAFFIDCFLILLVYIGISFFYPHLPFFPFLSYFIILPLLWNGKTIGKRLVNIQIVTTDEKKGKLAIFIRQVLFYFILLPSPFFVYHLWISSYPNQVVHFIKIFLILIFACYDLYFLFELSTSLLKREKHFYHERVTNTKNKSTIDWQKEENVIE